MAKIYMFGLKDQAWKRTTMEKINFGNKETALRT